MRSQGNYFEKIVVPRMSQTLVPCKCTLKDKLTIVAKRSFIPAEFLETQQCIEAEANGNTLFFWVEDCIRLVSVSYYDWLVFAPGVQTQVGCVHQNINLGTTTWLANIEGTQYEFGERIEAVAAYLAFGA